MNVYGREVPRILIAFKYWLLLELNESVPTRLSFLNEYTDCFI